MSVTWSAGVMLLALACGACRPIDAPVDAPSETPPKDAADGPEDHPANGEQCLAPMTWHYETAGCDGQARRTCGRRDMDACFSKVLCGCDGQDIVICEFSTLPWRREGPCTGAFDAIGQ